jgi:hypothetical protein
MKDKIFDKLQKGTWQIVCVNDLYYQKKSAYSSGKSFSAQVEFKNLETSEIKKVYVDVSLLSNKVPGYIFKNEEIIYNSKQGFEPKIIEFDTNSVSTESEYFQDVFNLKSDDNIENYGIYNSYRFSSVHKITIGSEVFIITTNELLRFFFLKGNKFINEILYGFISVEESKANRFDSLYLFPSDQDKVNYDLKPEHNPFLFVKEGLSLEETKAIFRIALVPNAYSFVKKLQEKIISVNNDENIDKKFIKYKSLFPANCNDLKMIVTGSSHTLKGKTFFLVNEIHDVQEKLPYSKIFYLPFVDHRLNGTKEVSGTQNNVPKPPVKRNPTKPSSESTITDSEIGNKDLTNIDSAALPGFRFEKEEIEVEKLAKRPSKIKYVGSATTDKENSNFTTSDKIDENSNNSRANLFEGNKVNDRRRVSFLKALKLLRDDEKFQLRFLQNPTKQNCEFSEEENIISSYNNKIDSKFNIILCELKSFDNDYFYIVKSDSDEDDSSRLGFFSSVFFNKIDEKIIFRLVKNKIGQFGVNVKINIIDIYFYEKMNQSDTTSLELKSKIKKRIDYYILKS